MAETLVATAIGSVLILGSVKALSVALQAGGVSRSILTENDFRMTLSKSLRNYCTANLKPEKLTGTNKNKGIGTLENIYSITGQETGSPQEISVINKGDYKTDIEVVKMELKGDLAKQTRTFVAFYKKKGLGHLNTVGNAECSAGKTEGCWTLSCSLDYQWREDDPATTGIVEGFEGCEVLNCNEALVSLAGVDCERTHGPGYAIGGFNDQGEPICKNLTADANPCPFGTQLKGYKTDGRPDCTAKRTCPDGYLLQSDGSCFIKEYSGNSAESCIHKTSEAEAKKVCADVATLKAYCRYYLELVETFSGKDLHCSVTHSYYKYKAKIYRRGKYDRETGSFTCYTLETPTYIASSRPWGGGSRIDNPRDYIIMGKKAGTSKCYERKGGTLKTKVNEEVNKIFTWNR